MFRFKSSCRSLKPLGDDEVINLLNKAKRWLPGVNEGHKFPMDETVTVEFKLTDK